MQLHKSDNSKVEFNFWAMPRSIEFNEEEVLRNAMLLFWEKGYYDTSIKDLIQALGISNASIYNSFGGKKQLFNRALAYYRETNFQGLRHFIQSQKDVSKGLTMFFEKIIQDDKNDEDCKGCFIVNTSTELIPTDPAIQIVIEKYREKIEKLFYDFLQMGVETGQIAKTKDIKVISRLLYTFMTGLRVLGKSKPSPSAAMASVKAVLSLLD